MQYLKTIHPTQQQRTVLAILASNKDHPTLAAEQLSGNRNLISARNILMNLHAITYSDTSATLTDIGIQLAKDHNIIDDMEELTDEGNKLLPQGSSNTPTPPPSDPMMDDQLGMDMPLEVGGQLPELESFSQLFKNIING